jgi:GNAT superfamily N-acetyltransferase
MAVSAEERAPSRRIRPATAGDGEGMADLTTQLGYPTTAEQSRERMQRVADLQRGQIFVAEAAGRVIGWTHVAPQYCLEAEPWAEVLGLVVDQAWRGCGVGGELIRSAEAWAHAHGFTLLRLRTNIVREEAHAFYRRRGFVQLKTQHVFVKDLSPGQATDPERRT